jgi:hypothetical protein
MVRGKDQVVFAWTEAGSPTRIKTAIAHLK